MGPEEIRRVFLMDDRLLGKRFQFGVNLQPFGVDVQGAHGDFLVPTRKVPLLFSDISCGCMENGDARLTPGFQYLKGIGADLFGMVAGKWMAFTHPRPCHVHGGDGGRLSKSHLAHETTLFIDFTCLSKCLFKKFLIKLIMVHKLIILIFCHVVCTPFFLGA